MDIINLLASELSTQQNNITAAIALLDEGATVPFIARYRKEATGGLDDSQLRTLAERLQYLRELQDRKQVVLKQIEEQGKLTDALKQSIESADNKSRVEDLYLPYKPKRRTKAQIAIEAGLEPLADHLLTHRNDTPEHVAENYLNKDKGIEDAKAALDGAKNILMERFSEQADLINELRQLMQKEGALFSSVIDDKKDGAEKFKDYFEFSEALTKIPSHRTLACLRGQKEEILRVSIDFLDSNTQDRALQLIRDQLDIQDQGLAADHFLTHVIDWTWRIKLKLKITMDSLMQLRTEAEEAAIDVFKNNLSHLLLAAPAGKKVTLGLDPGYRTGVKTVVVDDTGKLLEHTVIYPHAPQKQWDRALNTLLQLCQKHQVTLISIGNGTASRETDALASELLKSLPNVIKVITSEAGASVYSASELAAKEFPELDVSYRGAVSIARRLQDPLAELVKIDPKSIGVGQYQHDVNQFKLSQSLDNVVEDCVNRVGADVNTASVPLLKSIAGLNQTLAENIVHYREQHGRFKQREQLKDVPRMGAKTFEQCIGFLRIIDGDNPLDASSVHPEAYPLVDRILTHCNASLTDLMGNDSALQKIQAQAFTDEQFGLLTVKDIINELKKPGRDPRPEFVTAKLNDAVQKISDLTVGMKLEGTVTNVTNFGAFVDIGVHQDGLVHISHLANHFIKDPSDVVKPGDIVKVTVLEVDDKRKRIALSMKSSQQNAHNKKAKTKQHQVKSKNGAFGDLLQSAFNK